MGEAIGVTRSEDETASQLEGVSPESEIVLRVPGGFGAGASLGIVAPQQVQQVCALEFHGRIGLALFVDKQWKRDPRFFAKSACVDAIPKPYRRQVRSAVAEGLFVRAQLRDVLAAKDSTVMA
jgi:hypothetical protein